MQRRTSLTSPLLLLTDGGRAWKLNPLRDHQLSYHVQLKTQKTSHTHTPWVLFAMPCMLNVEYI